MLRHLRNAHRRLLRTPPRYVRIDLTGGIAEFAAPPPRWQRYLLGAVTPLSLTALRSLFRRIAAAPQTAGALLWVAGFDVGWATLQSLRAEIAWLRAAGKRVVVYLADANDRTYYLACAADAIYLAPPALFGVVGVLLQVQYLKNALGRLGIGAELTAVSRYKSGGDIFASSEMSAESREQLERLLDLRYAALVDAIADGRGLARERVVALIDAGPLSATAARAAGLIDGAVYEDEVELLLGEPATKRRWGLRQPQHTTELWRSAERALPLTAVARRRRLGLVTIEGTIGDGPSRRLPIALPLFGAQTAGATTVIQALRRAERASEVAAVIIYVDSRGGSATASDLIWREVWRLNQKKPVVAVFGEAAASGGYYVAASARAIVARPGTLTGSIGVFLLRPTYAAALELAQIGHVTLGRGANSGFFQTPAPAPAERAAMAALVDDSYAMFTERVRAGRGMAADALEPLAGGRVWLGTEALDRGLIDVLGGLPEGIAAAQRLAGLPPDPAAPLVWFQGQGEPLGPELATANPAALLAHWLRPHLWAILPWEA